MVITAFYAAILAVVFVVLSLRTIAGRQAARVEIGHADDRQLLRRVRVHANFAEYAPLALLLIGLAETLAAAPVTLHAAGSALVAGRLIHAYGFGRDPQIMALRALGMVLTFASIVTGAVTCLMLSVPRMF